MSETIKALSRSKLFTNIPSDNILHMIECLHSRTAVYEKGDMIISERDYVDEIGVILFGNARSIKTDSCGKITIVALLNDGDFMGVLLAASRQRKSPVSVQALSKLSAMFFPLDNIIGRCTKLCHWHDIMLRNFIDGIAEKALVLHDRNDCLIKTSVREKILTYLSQTARQKGSKVFTIPFDRNGMAEYLNVERSALSRELSRMKRDGLIDFFKSDFKLL